MSLSLSLPRPRASWRCCCACCCACCCCCAAWRTGTDAHPGAYLRFQPDGNLVVYAPDGSQLWASNTCCDAAADTFAVRADGNLVIFSSVTKHVYWSSNTALS